MENNGNNNNNGRNELNALVLAHCVAQSEIYAQSISASGYEPQTNVFELITVAETCGPTAVSDMVAAILTAVKFEQIPQPAAALRDLFDALKFKAQFYNDPTRKQNHAALILGGVYQSSLDVTHESLYEDMPDHIVEEVAEAIYE